MDIPKHSPVPFGYRLFTEEEKHNPSKSIFKVLGAIWWGKHSGVWRSLADYHHDQGSSLVFAVPDIEQIADFKAQVATADALVAQAIADGEKDCEDLKAQVEQLQDELWLRTWAERHRPSKRTEAKDGD